VVEVGLHQRALLVLEKLNVAAPDEAIRPTSHRCGRRRVLQDPTPPVDRLEAGEDRGVLRLSPQKGPEALDPIVGNDVGEVNPEDVVEDGVVRGPDGVHVVEQESAAPEAVRDVHVAGAIRVQAERKESQAYVVRGDGRHTGPLQAAGKRLVEPRVA
jgi:hypothetical protein